VIAADGERQGAVPDDFGEEVRDQPQALVAFRRHDQHVADVGGADALPDRRVVHRVIGPRVRPRHLADGTWPEARPGSVRDAVVEGYAADGDVESPGGPGERQSEEGHHAAEAWPVRERVLD